MTVEVAGGTSIILTPIELAVSIAAIATPVVIAIGFYFAYRQWKATAKTWKATANTRMAQIILSVTERWDSREMEESRQKISMWRQTKGLYRPSL